MKPIRGDNKHRFTARHSQSDTKYYSIAVIKGYYNINSTENSLLKLFICNIVRYIRCYKLLSCNIYRKIEFFQDYPKYDKATPPTDLNTVVTPLFTSIAPLPTIAIG